jgi:ATP-binding cassette subfamily C protein LapB
VSESRDHKSPKTAWDWFFYAIKKRRLSFIESIVASVVTSVLALGISFYTMQVYDRVVSSQSYSTLIVITIGVLLAIAIEFITKELRANILDRACQFIDIELSSIFFGRMLSIRMDARPKTVGTFAAQIKQFESVRNFLTSTTLFVFVDVPFVFFFIGVIWLIGGNIALVPLLLLPIAILVGFYSKWKMANLAEDQITESNQKNGLLVEAIDGIEAIKAVGGEWKMLDFWRDLTIKSAEKELTIRNVTNIAMNASQTVQQISYIMLIAFGVYAISKGSITMGALMACSILSNRALTPISQIAGKIVQWQHAKAALKGLDEMMKLPIDRNEDAKVIIPDRCKGYIKIKDVTFGYGKENQAIKNINLTFLPGEKIALIGPVGSGKSTLIKVLTGLYKPTEGQIFLDDVDMHHISPEFMRESIGYLTQDIRLFNGTLKYNLTIGLPTPKDSVILEACKETGLIEVIKQHPKGLDLPIFEGGRGLSGGQRQLVGLTRMLIAKPKILFLDEPTASMDGDLEIKVMQGLFKHSPPESTILLSTHKMALLNYVDRVIVLDKSKVLMDGTKQEVIAKLQSHLKRPSPSQKNNLA